MRAKARAHSNIALIKYWGKADVASNMPAVPSLSLTLDQLYTETEVLQDESLSEDEVFLDGEEQTGKAKTRVVQMLDSMRCAAKRRVFARVDTQNNFPTAAGLASSASGFAALALAASRAYALPHSQAELSSIARQSSASAGRSLFGGFVELGLGEQAARELSCPSDFEPALLVLVTTKAKKPIGSTEGMLHTKSTSPYYASWVSHAPRLFETGKAALAGGDLKSLGEAMEQSTLMMHASMFAAAPAVIYWTPTTLALMHAVLSLRAQGVPAYFTMDAGPHVKVLTLSKHRKQVLEALSGLPGVEQTYDCSPGPAAHLLEQ